jgi:hypothetical protein
MRPAASRIRRPGKKVSSPSTAPQSRNSDVSVKTKSLQPTAGMNRKRARESSLAQLKPAKQTRNRIPLPQQTRIIQKHFAGKSITMIAHEEGRNRESVARIVNSDEVRKVVQRARAEVYGCIQDALTAVRHALQEEKDARIGYRLLMDVGAIPLPAEAQANSIQAREPDQEELTPYERASAQDEFGQINPVALALVRMMNERDARSGESLPTAEEIWHNKTVAALIDNMTFGRSISISLASSVDFNQLKDLAEDVLRGKRDMATDKDILAVREKYDHLGRGFA